jgi:hypothetical protein
MSDDTVLGGGSYKCKKCGRTHFGSTVHYCEPVGKILDIKENNMSDDKQELIDALKKIVATKDGGTEYANLYPEAIQIALEALAKHSPEPWWVTQGFSSEPKDGDIVYCNSPFHSNSPFGRFGLLSGFRDYLYPISCPSYLKPKLGLWAAVDKDGLRCLFLLKPHRDNFEWTTPEDVVSFIKCDDSKFDHIFAGKSWTDEPWEV